MKRIDYYAIQQPWHMPKWLGATLGGIFAVIAIGSMITIVQLTRPPAPAPTAAVVAAPTPTAAPAPVAPAAQPAATPAPVASDEPSLAPAPHHKRHHAAHHKAVRLASAKRASNAHAATILARHDSKQKRREKDALDKLLGL